MQIIEEEDKITENQIESLKRSTVIEKCYEVFLFANPLSGSQAAKRYLKLEYDSCQLLITPSIICNFRAFDLTIPETCSRGIRHLLRA